MGYHKNLRGKDLHAPSAELVENTTGSTLTQLKVVSLDGMGTNFPKVILCNPSLTTAFGIVQDDILNNKFGYITVLGFMFEINTSAWPVGSPLYSGPTGNLINTPNGAVVAFVVKQHATDGVIYVTAGTAFSDPGSGSATWDLSGNLGTNPLVTFLGTRDAQPLKIRTNNIERMTVDANGRVGIGTATPETILDVKSHASPNASGLQIDTFYLETNDTLVNNAIVIPIADPSTVKIEFHAMARQTDGANRAAFERTALFYREASNAQIQGNWQSDFTQKSDKAFDVSYTLGATGVILKVKSATSVLTRWSGHIKIQKIF